ncbi:MAG: zinc-dependent alcohol dehydrogenase family protein [Actinobacteria bacterium]|nr:zinc-dependent alcohol dehydrogenase family protein [Actinomycetota bacterium]
MKYALIYGIKDIRIEEKPIPQKSPDRVLVKIIACGICGTDVHIYNGKMPIKFPYSPGHEFSGVIHSVGESIKNLEVGDRVVVDPNYNCESCYYCRIGYPNLCENLKTTKVKSNGGFAEYVAVPEKIVYKIPSDVSFEEATLIEPLSCSIHVIEESNIKFGDIVLIIGGGTMGLILLQLVKQKGAKLIILSEPLEFKRELALKLGADIVIDPINENLVSSVKRVSRHGANVIIEGIGLPETIEESFKILPRKGTLILPGLCPENKKINISPYQITKDEITIKGTFLNPFSFSRAIDKISTITATPLITNIYTLNNIKEAIEEAAKGDQIKIIIKPD